MVFIIIIIQRSQKISGSRTQVQKFGICPVFQFGLDILQPADRIGIQFLVESGNSLTVLLVQNLVLVGGAFQNSGRGRLNLSQLIENTFKSTPPLQIRQNTNAEGDFKLIFHLTVKQC